MRPILLFVLSAMLSACHAQQVASDKAPTGAKNTSTAEAPKQPEVSSARPVRTTPEGLLGPRSMRKIQDALDRHGEKAPRSGHLDDATQAALRSFQRKQSQPATGFPDFDTLHRLGLDPRAIFVGGATRTADRDK